MKKDWRVDNVESLRGQPLRWQQWKQVRENWDHDHCAGCWTKFAEFDGTDILHWGYATTDSYRLGAGYDWICESCFNDLKDEMDWRVVP